MHSSEHSMKLARIQLSNMIQIPNSGTQNFGNLVLEVRLCFKFVFGLLISIRVLDLLTFKQPLSEYPPLSSHFSPSS